VILVLVVLVCSLGFVSALNCTEGKIETKEADLNKIKTINGVQLGVASTSESNVLNRITATLFLHPTIVTIESTNSSQSVEVNEKDYVFDLISVSEDSAQIDFDGEIKEVCDGCLEESGGIQIKLVDLETSTPSSVDLLLGSSAVTLSNTDNPSEVTTLDGISYTLNLISVSDNDATLQVVCGGVEEVEDDEEEDEVSDKTYCVDEDRNMNCTAGGEGVCGSNDVDYENACLACINENVDYWKVGECEDPSCSGCLVSGVCYEIGNRMDEEYCEGIRFVEQKDKGEVCAESYECETNNCVDGECKKSSASSSGEKSDGGNFFGRVWRWIRGLFGGKKCPGDGVVDCVGNETVKYCEEDYRNWIGENCNVSFSG